MGKNLGFLEYQRKTSQAEEPLERIKHYNEFHLYLSNEEQSEQRFYHILNQSVSEPGL